MSNTKLYDEKSIESLSPLEFTRLKPGVYCGDTSYSTQLIIELVSNATDEFKLGHGKEIEVEIKTKEQMIKIRDYGQGFLVNSIREDGKSILEASFSVLNTSGKYSEDGVYSGTSLGQFGIGAKLPTFLSNWLDVTTHRDGQSETCHFEEGVFKNREISKSNSESGTTVIFKPSAEFFENPLPDVSVLKKIFKETACLCPGLTIVLTVDGKETKYFSKNGLNDLVDMQTKGKEIVKNRLSTSYKEGKSEMEICLTYTDGYSSSIVPYVNLGLTDAGPHITTFKSTLTREINKYARENKILKDKDENLAGEDVQEGLFVIFNLTYAGVSYDAQVKSRITSKDFNPFINKVLTEALQDWFTSSPADIKLILDKALKARKAREAARKAREKARGVKEDTKAPLKFASKLADAWSEGPEARKKCEVFIVEGDSASGTLKLAKNNEFQAVLPIRGKILNCHKASLDKILANSEVKDIITSIGLEIDSRTAKVVFDEEKLRYGKIIIASDADPDGKCDCQ